MGLASPQSLLPGCGHAHLENSMKEWTVTTCHLLVPTSQGTIPWSLSWDLGWDGCGREWPKTRMPKEGYYSQWSDYDRTQAAEETGFKLIIKIPPDMKAPAQKDSATCQQCDLSRVTLWANNNPYFQGLLLWFNEIRTVDLLQTLWATNNSKVNQDLLEQ